MRPSAKQEQAAYQGLTPSRVAPLLFCSTAHVRKLIQLGPPLGLEAIDVSAGDVPRYVVMPAEVERFKRARKVQPKAAA